MKILFFAPHSAVWIHAFPEALVAEALAQEGHEVVYVGCGGLLSSHCVSMSAYAVPFEASPSLKQSICNLCKQNEKVIRDHFGFGGTDLTGAITEEDMHVADSVVSSLTPQNCVDLVIDEVEVGRVALYELLLQSKKTEIVFSDAEWRRYQASVKNAVLVLRTMGRILASEKPDRVVAYNTLYSVNRIVCRLAQINGIAQYFLHAGDNLSTRLNTLILARGQAFEYYGNLRKKWASLQDRPTTELAMQSSTNHFLEVARGRSIWAYSAAAGSNTDLRDRFCIEAARKVICATMSSSDERFSGEVIGILPTDNPLIFPTQVDWIKALIDYVKEKQNLSLIIRVHPREFPNKRENVMSEHARMLQIALAGLPDNVKVNWPTDNVSLYDLANITDVFANAWSSAGKEMAWLGLPVVLYSQDLTLYPANLNYVGTTQEDYFQKIEQALRDGWDPERIRRTYRWCALEYMYGALDISNSFNRKDPRSFVARVTSRLLRTAKLSWEQQLECRKRAKRLGSSQQINRILEDEMSTALDLEVMDATVSYTQETQFLKKEVHRLAAGLYGAAEGASPHVLADKLRNFANS